MEDQITSIIRYMVNTQRQMAKILESERHVVDHIAKIVQTIPDRQPTFTAAEAIVKNTGEVTKSISSYLISLADFEEAIGTNLAAVMKELQIKDEGE